MTKNRTAVLSRKSGRDRLAQDTHRTIIDRFDDITYQARAYDNMAAVPLIGPKLSASITMFANRRKVPVISWYGAKARLRSVLGAWLPWDVNAFHGLKATSFPEDPQELIERLLAGFEAAKNGTAFGNDG